MTLLFAGMLNSLCSSVSARPLFDLAQFDSFI